MTHGVSGNKLFFVCTVCGPSTEQALEFARRKNAGYERILDRRLIEDWFDRHAECGGTRDHFKMGMTHNPDWDAAQLVSPDSNVKAAVRLALVKSDTVKT
jgi:hypothetical protein